MNEIFSSDNFIVAMVAITSIGISVFVKSASRRDRHRFFTREDLAVGLDLLGSSIIILITRSSDRNDVISPWILLIFLFILWGTSTWVRRCGWEQRSRLKFLEGVLAPNLVGGLALMFVIYNT